MNVFTIKDLENLSGIKAHTIRIWEQRYHFLKPCRTETNIRYYSNEELKKVLNVALLNKYGFKISHINKMDAGEVNEKILSLTQTLAQQERIINELIEHMIELRIQKVEGILDNYIQLKGIERAITQIIFPFMEKIGILWITNHINPAQEHLVTNIIRQKLIVGIESANSTLKVDKTILLFLPEGEYHEIGLLVMYYILKSRGVNTIYLGSNVPLKDVEYVVNLMKPDYLYTHITSGGQNFNIDKFVVSTIKKFINTPIIISGQLAQSFEKKIPPHVSLKKSYSEVMEFVMGL